MSSTKEIRNRIKSIKNTAKITNAMEMVAASKMKKSQDSTLKNRPYAEGSGEVLINLSREQTIVHPLLEKKPLAKKSLLMVITSDKGLCGSFNAAVIRQALLYLKDNPATDLITVGKKGQNFFKRMSHRIVATFTDFPLQPRSHDIRPIVHAFTDNFLSGQHKEVAVIYTHFESTLKQIPTLKIVLPLGINQNDSGRGGVPSEMAVARTKFEPRLARTAESEGYPETKNITIKFEPSAAEVINFLLPRILETQIFQMILESTASEQSARMVAMKNATDAADDLVDDLNLTYNSLRQSNITQELAEISAATSAAANR